MTTRLLLIVLAIFLLALLSACAKNLKPDQVMQGPLNYLQEGKTTREEALLHLGTPTADFEKGRILTYRIGQDGEGGIFVRPRQAGLGVPQNALIAEFSLVLVFDDKGLLKKQKLVSVK
jgi:hypothetical protein